MKQIIQEKESTDSETTFATLRRMENESAEPQLESEGVTLRPVHSDDRAFLYKVYASTRTEELAPLRWSVRQQQDFLRMQFNLRQKDYESRLDAAGHQIILRQNLLVGVIWVSRNEGEIRIADLSLLPAYRGKGIGTKLIRELLDESDAVGKPVRLMVWKMNKPALRLYERLGFSVVGDTEIHFLMERPPAKSRSEATVSRD